MVLPSPPPAALVVRAHGLAQSYGRGSKRVDALRGIDVELAPGACLGLLGRNGSGKSTTIKLVLGLLSPLAGTLEVFGGMPGRRAARARTGYVPEEARRFGHLSGRETVAMFAALQGVRPRRERRTRVAAALEDVGLAPSAYDQKVEGYSRGMARRLALATAWVHRPSLLVLDEPTSGLDPLGKEEVLALLERHAAAGGATLISTHDRVTAEAACDHVIVLDRGRVVRSGEPCVLLAGDTTPSLASLLRGAPGA